MAAATRHRKGFAMTAAAPANNIIPFGFEDHLVRVYKPNGEPWFVGKDVCSILEIKDHNQALNRLDEDERSGCTVPTPRGEQTMIVVSEAGVFRLIFSSRKPEAERFKKWLAHEVLPQLRRHGFYALPGGKVEPGAERLAEFPADDTALSVHLAKLATLKECRMIHGPRAAARLWQRLGMPQVAESVIEEVDEGRRCLTWLLDSPSIAAPILPEQAEGFRIRNLVEAGLNDNEGARKTLLDRFALMIIVEDREEGLFVPNSEDVPKLWKGSPWSNGKHAYALRKLVGARTIRKSVGRQRRGVFIPASVIDSIPFANAGRPPA